MGIEHCCGDLGSVVVVLGVMEDWLRRLRPVFVIGDEVRMSGISVG